MCQGIKKNQTVYNSLIVYSNQIVYNHSICIYASYPMHIYIAIIHTSNTRPHPTKVKGEKRKEKIIRGMW